MVLPEGETVEAESMVLSFTVVLKAAGNGSSSAWFLKVLRRFLSVFHLFRRRVGRAGPPASSSVLLPAHALNDAGPCGALPRLHLFHGVAQFPSRQKAVEFTGSVHVAFDGDSRREMFEVNAVVGFIHLLAAVSAAADKAFLQILFTNAQGFHPLLESGQFFRPYHNRNIAGR